MATVKTRISLADHGRRMSLYEYLCVDFVEGYRYELARGVIEVAEVPDDPHVLILYLLHRAFDRWADQNPTKILWIAHGGEVRLIIPELESERNPDLGIVFRGTRPNERGRLMPRLVVEVARDRDDIVIAEEYLVFGILEYWIVDQFLRQVSVLTRREQDGVSSWSERIFRDSDLIVSELLPGFAATVSDLWRDAFPQVEAELP